MSVHPTRAARLYRDHIERIDELLGQAQAAQEELRQRHDQLAEALLRARLELAAAYLPELTPEALARAERLTGFRGFTRRDPIKAMAKERVTLEKVLASIRADQRYQRRRYLVGPQGSLTRQLEEARSMAEPWEREAARFEELEGFLELVETGYDTPDYSVPWYSPRYWRLWARGDAICEALGMDDFGDDVLPAYRKVAAERDRWREQIAGIEARIDEVHALVQQHDRIQDRLAHLPEIVLAESQRVLADFIEQADLPLLHEWLDEDEPSSRPIRMGLKRVAALQAKLDFIEQLERDGLAALERGLRRRREKYERKRAKYHRWARKGRYVDESSLDTAFTEKSAKLARRIEKVRKLARRIDRFDDFERLSLEDEPELWWEVFTGHRPGSLTPELSDWYERHPGARPHLEAPLHEGVAEAVADRELDELDGLS